MSAVLSSLLATLLVGGSVVSLGSIIERRWFAHAPRFSATLLNIRCFVAAAGIQAVLLPTFASLAALGINHLGGGLILLPSKGWELLPSILVYTLAMDVGEYAFHRAQHAVPWLWSMHTLHHSDDALNVSTTLRHFWPEQLLKTVTIFLIVGLLFKINLAVVVGYNLISMYNFVAHTNVRLGYGRWSWLINSPQYHRLHHSRLEKDVGYNYAALFPVFDVVCGTYRKPAPGEYPPTGLADCASIPLAAQMLIWPRLESPERFPDRKERRIDRFLDKLVLKISKFDR